MSTPDLSWRAWHIFYHGNRNLVLTKLVRPVIGSLLTSREIDSFFFMRYNLGGPHIRLRLRLAPERADEVEARLEEAASEFFEHWPSTTPLPEDSIRQDNVAILADAPLEDDDSVYPDNFLQPFEFKPETQRYGGGPLLEPSLDYFALSSALALRFVETYGEMPWARQLPIAFGILARQAWGFTASTDELLDLLIYARAFWGDASPKIVAKGNQIFDRQPEVFCSLLQRELRPVSAADLTDPAQGAHRLSEAISLADQRTRGTILKSHMHMLANRLGVRAQEEIYLGQILLRSFERSGESDPSFREELDATLAAREETASGRGGLRELLLPAFEAFELSGKEPARAP